MSDHHAIIPTEIRPNFDTLTNRETKLYLMVAQRFLETLMDPYQYEATQVILKVGEYQFKHAKNVTRKLGFKALSNNDSTFNKTITFSKDETYHVQQVKVSEHETTPPEYFNEGSLLKAMENPQNYIQLNDKSTLIPFIKREELEQ